MGKIIFNGKILNEENLIFSQFKRAVNFGDGFFETIRVVNGNEMYFEDHFKRGKPLPVVRPGTQTRRFTHIDDTIQVCFEAWKKNLCRHYSIANKKSYSLIDVAKMFKSKIKFLPKRAGERYASALTDKNLSNKIFKYFGKVKLKDYIEKYIDKN